MKANYNQLTTCQSFLFRYYNERSHFYSKFLPCIVDRMCNNCAIIFIFKSFEYSITNSFVVALVTAGRLPRV